MEERTSVSPNRKPPKGDIILRGETFDGIPWRLWQRRLNKQLVIYIGHGNGKRAQWSTFKANWLRPNGKMTLKFGRAKVTGWTAEGWEKIPPDMQEALREKYRV